MEPWVLEEAVELVYKITQASKNGVDNYAIKVELDNLAQFIEENSKVVGS